MRLFLIATLLALPAYGMIDPLTNCRAEYTRFITRHPHLQKLAEYLVHQALPPAPTPPYNAKPHKSVGATPYLTKAQCKQLMRQLYKAAKNCAASPKKFLKSLSYSGINL